MKKWITILLVVIKVTLSFSQTVFTDLRSVRSRAEYYHSHLAYVKAADLYAEALKRKKHQNNYSLNKNAADLFKKLSRYNEARMCYENMRASGHLFSKQDSINYFNIVRALSDATPDSVLSQFSQTILNSLLRDSLCYTVFPVPFNTLHSEYCSTSSGNGIFFVSDKEDTTLVRSYNALNNGGFACTYYAERADTSWHIPVKVLQDRNDVLHIGPVSFYDRTSAIVNVCIEGKSGTNRLELYTAEFDAQLKRWNIRDPLPVNSASYSVGHPAISKDGTHLFFVSDKKGGLGGTDLYVTEFKNGTWTEAVNLGPSVNTAGDEKYPFFSEDHILFFASDGRYGMGGLDIYYCDFLFKDTIAVNMGFPVNSNLDDFAFSYDKAGNAGYFSSNRNTGKGGDDLYWYTEKSIYFELRILDDFDKQLLNDCKVELMDMDFNIPLRYRENKTAEHLYAHLRPHHHYQCIISKPDYQNDTIRVSTEDIYNFSAKVERTVHLRRKLLYKASLKFKTGFPKESFKGALILVHNITESRLDTLSGDSLTTVTLDGCCEYIITSQNEDKLRYIYVEKKNFRISSSIPYYNLYLGAASPSILHIRIKSCTEESNEESLPSPHVKVGDWVNRNEFNITPGPEGDFQLVVTDDRLFDLFIDGKKIKFSQDEIVHELYCIKFIR